MMVVAFLFSVEKQSAMENIYFDIILLMHKKFE